MRYSGIGGQAVIEGVMMRNGDDYAVAVRKPDHEIAIRKQKVSGPGTDHWSRKIPIVRGVLSFADSLVLGMGALSVSSEYFDEEDEDDKKSVEEDDSAKSEKKQKKEKLENTLILVSSFVLAIVVFMIIPYLLSLLFKRFGLGDMLITLIEGVIRVVIFLAYMFFISFLEDIKRTYMYHGAEHKCINCIESGLELNVENVRKSSRFHKRCGTSFLFVVVIVSIVVFMFIRVDSRILRLALRLLLIPVVAGISYEFIRLAGRYDNPVINLLSKPGLWLQKLSTAEPDDDMIEVGIASVEAVFDWKDFISKSENSNGDNSK
ncbi:MAG: DUF1385 domain-containing protein [Lachnospiraceae bacterium]|nr:DUF1385 domain-containing protein [Lachnospiraceae bacterium]